MINNKNTKTEDESTSLMEGLFDMNDIDLEDSGDTGLINLDF